MWRFLRKFTDTLVANFRGNDGRSDIPISEHTVREVALAMPVAVPVFAHVGIEFGCGGDVRIVDACREIGLSVKHCGHSSKNRPNSLSRATWSFGTTRRRLR